MSMKAKYATLIRNLLNNYHEQAKSIETETFSVHSDGLQLMELNVKLAKCLEGISATAMFNNDKDDFDELHKITLQVFSGNIPEFTGLTSLLTASMKNPVVNHLQTVHTA